MLLQFAVSDVIKYSWAMTLILSKSSFLRRKMFPPKGLPCVFYCAGVNIEVNPEPN